MRSVKIGIIGIGNMGFAHAQCIYNEKVTGFKLVAVCDINEKTEQTVLNTFRDVDFYTDYNELLNREDIEAVIIATPHPLHADIAMAALKAGKNVLVEKPVDICVSKAKKLNEVASKSDKKFAIMFNQRTDNLFQEAKRIVESGELGELKRSVWIITNWYRTQYYYNTGDWRATWSGEGGGVLMNQAPHQLDLWQWICGMPTKVTAFCEVAKHHKIEVEDSATIYAKFKNGAEGVFITTTGEYPGTNRLEISGSKGKLVLENGVLKWWKLFLDENEYSATEQKSTCDLEYEYIEILEEKKSGHIAILQNFADSIIEDKPLVAPGIEGINELTIQNAAYLSAWSGNAPVEIPFDTEKFDEMLTEKQKNSSSAFTSKGIQGKNGYKECWNVNW